MNVGSSHTSGPPEVPRENRRPLNSRGSFWAKALAAKLLALGAKPNHVSLASIAAAGLGGSSLLAAGAAESGTLQALFFLLAGGFIQLRLLCNLLDGMLAVEGGLRSATGELYNDLPDRISDLIIFLAAGYSVHEPLAVLSGPTLGWMAAVIAVMTAYIRVLGAAAGTHHFFSGPMAKQHRMALMTAGSAASAYSAWSGAGWAVLPAALWLVILGGALTCVRRLKAIANELSTAPASGTEP